MKMDRRWKLTSWELSAQTWKTVYRLKKVILQPQILIYKLSTKSIQVLTQMYKFTKPRLQEQHCAVFMTDMIFHILVTGDECTFFYVVLCFSLALFELHICTFLVQGTMISHCDQTANTEPVPPPHFYSAIAWCAHRSIWRPTLYLD